MGDRGQNDEEARIAFGCGGHMTADGATQAPVRLRRQPNTHSLLAIGPDAELSTALFNRLNCAVERAGFCLGHLRSAGPCLWRVDNDAAGLVGRRVVFGTLGQKVTKGPEEAASQEQTREARKCHGR